MVNARRCGVFMSSLIPSESNGDNLSEFDGSHFKEVRGKMETIGLCYVPVFLPKMLGC